MWDLITHHLMMKVLPNPPYPHPNLTLPPGLRLSHEGQGRRDAEAEAS